MNRILKLPAVNAVCISLFTAFYALIFLMSAERTEFKRMLYYQNAPLDALSFWQKWSDFLSAGQQVIIAWSLVAITAFIVVLLIRRAHPYDEYHTAILVHCLIISIALTLVAIALFYLAILSDPNGIVEKFTFFIAVHWASVVLADLIYVILCRR